MPVSSYQRPVLLDATFSGTVYLKLHTGDPGTNCTDSAAVETTRKVISFAAADGGTVVSDSEVSWTDVAATETYTHVSLWDHLTAGNALWYGHLVEAKSVREGDTFTLSAGSVEGELG